MVESTEDCRSRLSKRELDRSVTSSLDSGSMIVASFSKRTDRLDFVGSGCCGFEGFRGGVQWCEFGKLGLLMIRLLKLAASRRVWKKRIV